MFKFNKLFKLLLSNTELILGFQIGSLSESSPQLLSS